MSDNKKLTFGIFGLFAAVYLATMCPTVYTMDNGELIVASYKLHIAHPTGYPLFCILGKLFSWLIPIGSIAWRINAMNALIAASAVAVLFLAFTQMVERRFAALGALLIGVSPVFWDIATSADVHALSALLVGLQLLFFLRWWKTGDAGCLCYLALSVGLAATNHFSALLIAPGLLLGVLMRNSGCLRDRKLVLKVVLLFILPLALYSYIPTRAASSAGTIWGDIYASTGLLGHITGRVFGSRMFSLPMSAVMHNIGTFAKLILQQFSVVLVWLLPLGIYALGRVNWKLLCTFGVMVFINVLYAVNYDIPDIEPYYLPTMIVLAAVAAMGAEFVVSRIRIESARRIAYTLAIASVVVLSGFTLPKVDKHNTTYIMSYANNTFKTAAKNALVIECGDATYNAVLYGREVEKKRLDLMIVERNTIRNWIKGSKNWTGRHYCENSFKRSSSISRLLRERKYSRREIGTEKLLADIVGVAMTERPVYISCIGDECYRHPIVRRLEKDFQLVPEGMLLRVLPKSAQIDYVKLIKRNEALWASYDLTGISEGCARNELEREVPMRYAISRLALADFELRSRMYARAEQNYKWAIMADDRLNRARDGLGIALASQGKCAEAVKVWEKALKNDPNDQLASEGIKVMKSTQKVRAR